MDGHGQTRWSCGRAFVLFALPTLVLIVVWLWPVIGGRETLVLRDTLQVHLTLKAPQAEAMRAGYFPLIDSRRGGQPLAGNPNAVPFYPDNLLYLVAPLFWAFNAHFWLHLLAALFAAAWMARAWGLPPPAAWATGVVYASSGFMLSQLNFYNLVAGAALAPALVAAVLRAAAPTRDGSAPPARWAPAAAGALWALLLLSGDPLSAAMAAFLAAGALMACAAGGGSAGPAPAWPGGRRLAWLALGLVSGTLVALPQIVEFLRILPTSLRGHRGFSAWRLTAGSWQPAQALDWLVPLPFGRFDLQGEGAFWGQRFFDGLPPIFLSLYPGLLALTLIAAAGRPRTRAAWWGWASVAAGIFLALGAHNPAARWLFELPGARSFRYPVKLWLLVAVGAALLCGIGFQRVFGPAWETGAAAARARLRAPALALAGAALVLAGLLVAVVAQPEGFESLVLRAAPDGWEPFLAAAERGRWIATLVVSLTLAGALAGALALARSAGSGRPRRVAAAAALLVGLHAAGQLYLLRSLAVTDEVAVYERAPAALAALPPGTRLAHAEYDDLFGPQATLIGPDHRFRWILRQRHDGLLPFAGVRHGLTYELARSPEGLDSFLSRAARDAVAVTPSNAVRLTALAHWGVERVVTFAPLAGAPPEVATLAGTFPGVVAPVYVYRLARPAPEILFAEEVLEAPHLNAAWALVASPGFDPERQAVFPGGEAERAPPAAGSMSAPAGMRILRRGPEALEVEIAAPAAGALVVQQSHLPLWRATIDGEPAAVEPANLYRLGVRVPAGRHRVRLWVDRRPLLLTAWAAAAGVLGLLVLLGRPRGV